mmetsp:Transcript_14340/g.26340  ORF Transcript_14340/g.26340 Transcript_14340/m.26340 type:complete len:326 (-) Transcript_14340:41-1018(-)
MITRLVILLLMPVAQAVVFRQFAKASRPRPPTFEEFALLHSTGPAFWKWDNSLQVFEHHFAKLVDKKPHVAEVGEPLMQGSMEMWNTALGEGAVVLATSTIEELQSMIQAHKASVNMSAGEEFHLDILAEGGADAQRMLRVLKDGFPLLGDGGYFVAEELHGPAYVEKFLKPAAGVLGDQFQVAELASVHLYPYLLLARRKGDNVAQPPYKGSHEVVANYTELFEALPRQMGGYVKLENEAWDPMLTEDQLARAMRMFAALHDAYWYDEPTGCTQTKVAVCRLAVNSSNMQSLISGVHIYPTFMIVEVADEPIEIEAVRRGTEWP